MLCWEQQVFVPVASCVQWAGSSFLPCRSSTASPALWRGAAVAACNVVSGPVRLDSTQTQTAAPAFALSESQTQTGSYFLSVTTFSQFPKHLHTPADKGEPTVGDCWNSKSSRDWRDCNKLLTWRWKSSQSLLNWDTQAALKVYIFTTSHKKNKHITLFNITYNTNSLKVGMLCL